MFPRTIHKKIWLTASFIMFLFVVEGGVTFLISYSTKRYLDPMRVRKLTMLVEIYEDIEKVSSLLVEYANTGEEAQIVLVEIVRQKLNSLLAEMEIIYPGESLFYKSINTSFNKYLQDGKKVARDLMSSQTFNSELSKSTNDAYKNLHTKIETHISEERYQLLRIFNEASTNFTRNQNFLIFITFLVTLLCFFTIRVFVRSITKPISIFNKATKSLGDGHLDIEVKIESRDEFQILGNSFNYMVRSLREKTKRLEDARNHSSLLLENEINMEAELRKTNEAYKNACGELRYANRAQSEFLANMSHELRTPMNAIINLTDQVVEDWDELKTDEKWEQNARDMLKRVIRSSNHLLSMINDLLDLAKIESGKMTLNVTPCDIIWLLENTLADVSSLAHTKGLNLKIYFPDTMPELYCDERMIKQVFINLLSNAIKFTEKGCVSVIIKQLEKEYCSIEVMDTGIGIPEKKIDLVFNRFRQIDSSESRKYQGTGLGLNLVWEILRLHGGEISAKSVLGEGSRFIVRLPLVAKGYDRGGD